MPALVVLIGCFYLITLRPGQDWTSGDDFAQYIGHARNIVEGRRYDDTGYLYNPDLPVIGPRAYPPVFPLFLAPVYAVFGLNLLPMKALVVVFFILALIMVDLLFRDILSLPERVAVVALVGLNPYFWDFKDNVLSDIPFLFFTYLALLLATRAPKRHADTRTLLPFGGLLGSTLYLAYGTRSAGLAMVVAVLMFDVLTLKRVSRSTMSAVLVFACLAGIQHALLASGDDYLDQLAFDPGALSSQLFTNGFALAAGSSTAWLGTLDDRIRVGAFAGLTTVAGLGYATQVRRDLSVREVFACTYLLLILAWPRGREIRFLIPVAPLYIVYMWLGLKLILRQRPLQRVERTIAGLLLAGALLTYAARYVGLDYGPIREGVAAPESVALFEYVRQHTQPTDVLVFLRPRVLALFTDRRVGAFASVPNGRPVWDYLRAVQPTYAIATPSDRSFWAGLAECYGDRMEPVYANSAFQVYRLHLVDTLPAEGVCAPAAANSDASDQ